MAITKITASLSQSVKRLACKQTRIKMSINSSIYIGTLLCVFSLGCSEINPQLPDDTKQSNCIPLPTPKPVLDKLIDTSITEKISDDCVVNKEYLKGKLFFESIGHTDSSNIEFSYHNGYLRTILITGDNEELFEFVFYKASLIFMLKHNDDKNNFKKIINDSLYQLLSQDKLPKG